ncbi:MAG: DUF2442 domain-containing protein [Thermoflexaceae bacterium]|nr:DUF2442 domain-containing protein [Thermoflexaceae bacterium]
MYISNGYVCAGELTDFLKIENIKVLPDMIMILTFSTGEQRVFDATVLSGPVFEPLKEPDVFSGAKIEHGVVTWLDGEIDCAPEYMYKHSYEYSMVS